jgi:hypothetical protein
LPNFRKDNGAAIRAVCSQFVVLCRQLGLFTRAVIAIDGSKFKAVNNRDRNDTVAKVTGRMEQVDASIARYLRALDQADQAGGGTWMKTHRVGLDFLSIFLLMLALSVVSSGSAHADADGDLKQQIIIGTWAPSGGCQERAMQFTADDRLVVKGMPDGKYVVYSGWIVIVLPDRDSKAPRTPLSCISKTGA